MIIIAGICILFGIVYATNGYSQMHMRPELLAALMKHNGVPFGTPGREIFAGILFLAIGFWIIWKRNEKEVAKLKKIVDSVDWKTIRKKVGKVKDDAKKSMYLKITAGNETTYAEITEYMSWKRNVYSNGHWINTDWYLEAFLDVPEDFMKRHLDDYVSIDYPDSGVEFFKSESGSCSDWLRCYLGIPRSIPEKEIRAHVGAV